MITMKKPVYLIGAAVVLVAVGAAAIVYSGAYNVAADVPHTRPVYTLLEVARERSIAVQSRGLTVPLDIDDPARIRQGAGNYAAMCAGCHLSPGAAETELSRGLYPAPPNLTKEAIKAEQAFWTIKHGIKASGMPAWGKSMGDDFIWNMAAFLQELPKLDKSGYDVLVAGSGGHSHGGGEAGDSRQADDSKGHHDSGDHDHGDSVDHGMPTSPVPLSSAKSPSSIPAPAPAGRATAPAAAPAPRNMHEGMDMSKSPATEPARSNDDGHDNQH
ncbi:c-type cytochrome [Xanthomonas arboricola]|uniref:c-type cytochrome n=1 Tax=Xanthomonas arboricola TaxID=56448 RepID=UPI0009D773D1|nr:cytochrome c [Xanthomonas arboricola]